MTDSTFGPPGYAIRIDGEDHTDDLRGRMVSLEVREDLHLLGWFEIGMADGAEAIPPGSRVEIWMGRGSRLARVAVGDVTGIGLEVDARRGTLVRVRGLDPLHRLARSERTRSFRDVRRSDVVEAVAREAGLRAQVEETPTVLPHLLQANETDYHLLRRLARVSSFEMFWRDGGLVFRSLAAGEGIHRTLEAPREVGRIRADLSLARQVSGVTVKGWARDRKEAIAGRADPGDIRPFMGGEATGAEMADRSFPGGIRSYVDEEILSPEEADRAAAHKLRRIALGAVRGEITLPGDERLRMGRLIDLRGAREDLDGVHYIVGVRHQMDSRRGYRTHLHLRRNAAGPAPPSLARSRPARTREAAPGRGSGETPREIRVLDAAGEPLAGRSVVLHLPGGREIRRRTDARGAIQWPEEAGPGPVDLELPSADPSWLSE